MANALTVAFPIPLVPSQDKVSQHEVEKETYIIPPVTRMTFPAKEGMSVSGLNSVNPPSPGILHELIRQGNIIQYLCLEEEEQEEDDFTVLSYAFIIFTGE